MQLASKCAVFQILLDKIHLYFCAPVPLIKLKLNLLNSAYFSIVKKWKIIQEGLYTRILNIIYLL